VNTKNSGTNTRTSYAKNGFIIFVTCLITRILFKVLSGYDNFQLFGDSYRYDNLSDQIIAGNGNMDIIAYLCAPLYPYTLALCKLIAGQNWEMLAIGFQFLLVALSAVYIYKLGNLLFKDEVRAVVAALIYIFYPLTLWYNFTLAQETSFQAYFIFFLYYFLSSIMKRSNKNTILASIFFTLAFLTKSHVTPLFIPIVLVFGFKSMWKQLFLFVSLSLLMTLPHGLKNLNQHGIYTLSSQGNASLFLLGHSESTYPCLTKQAGEFGDFSVAGCNPNIVFDVNYDYGALGLVNQRSAKERNSIRQSVALDWIKSNPSKFWELKKLGITRAILPGVDRLQYKKVYWLLSLIAGLLIYVPGYFFLFKSLKKDKLLHFLPLCIVLLCAAIFMVFFPINRFRVITMEPMLCVYAASFYRKFWRSKEDSF